MDLKEKARNLPLSPGVYLMKDSIGSIIYVGKSKKLKSRVSSYFQNSTTRSPKVEKLVMNIKDFEYVLTDTEFEAFLLECKLIKDLKPRYNRMMKSPLSYVYIKINTKEAYPGIEVINSINKEDGSLYFGPYTSKGTAERAVLGIKEHCRIICSGSHNSNRSCLNYSLGLCIGICLGNSRELYMGILNKIAALLQGTDKSIIDEMEQKMLTASQNFDFETAAKYRDYIASINSLISRSKIKYFAEENKNIAMLEFIDEHTAKFFLIKGNRIIFSEKYNLRAFDKDQLVEYLKLKILELFNYSETVSSFEISRDDIDEAQIIYSYLKNNNCNYIIIPDATINTEDISALDNQIETLFISKQIY